MDKQRSSLIVRDQAVRDVARLVAPRFADCDQVILFGSRAVSRHLADSDVDLLCITERVPRGATKLRRRNITLDVVCVSTLRLQSHTWLGSELAGHIATYGIWLQGKDDWTPKVRRSQEAISRKAGLIESRVSALCRHWDMMSSLYHDRFSRIVRRDLQRLDHLVAGIPVPPSPILDDAWRETPHLQDRLTSLAKPLIRNRDAMRFVGLCLRHNVRA